MILAAQQFREKLYAQYHFYDDGLNLGFAWLASEFQLGEVTPEVHWS
ncbi:MAG: hypothetical protein ACJA13_002499 [Paraglaciecola sp.]|jgi:hypothetical protein